MKKDYKKKTIDSNAKTGESAHKCRLYDDFNTLYGCKSGTRPECTLSSSSAVESKPTENTCEDDDCQTPCKVAKKDRKKLSLQHCNSSLIIVKGKISETKRKKKWPVKNMRIK